MSNLTKEQYIERLHACLNGIRDLVDDRVDVEDRPDGEGVRPNIFMRIAQRIDEVLR